VPWLLALRHGDLSLRRGDLLLQGGSHALRPEDLPLRHGDHALRCGDLPLGLASAHTDASRSAKKRRRERV
jgi:hypothetical protein